MSPFVNFLFVFFHLHFHLFCYIFLLKYKSYLHRKGINPLQCHIFSIFFVFHLFSFFYKIWEHASFRGFLCGFVCFCFNGCCLWHAWEGLYYLNFKQTDIHLVFLLPSLPFFFLFSLPIFQNYHTKMAGAQDHLSACSARIKEAPSTDLSLFRATLSCHVDIPGRMLWKTFQGGKWIYKVLIS